MNFKKRGAAFAVVGLMLCVAIYLNWSYNRNESDLTSASSAETGKTLGEAKLVDISIEDPSEEISSNNEDTEKNDVSTENQYFSDAKLSRQQARDEAMSILQSTACDESASEDAKKSAEKELAVLASNAVKEASIESLIMAKGYSKCVVFINDSGVNVIIAPKEDTTFGEADAAKVKDIVISETSVKADQIKIVPVEV